MSENSDKNLPIEAPDDPRNEKPLVEHLIELRNRMVKAILAVVIVFLVLSPFMKQLFDALSHPLMVALPAGTKLLSTGVVAPFLVPLKVTLFVSFLIALPVVLYQAWAYVAPALYRQEKKLVLPVLVSSVAMFFVGVMYCYFVVFRFVFRFIAQFSPESVNFAPDIDSYFSFVITMFFAFGLTFEVPIVVMVLNHVGIASLEALKKARPYIIVGAFVIAAIFTPPDVLSQTLLALPLVILYQAGIWLVQLFGKKNPKPFMEAEQEEIAELEKREREEAEKQTSFPRQNGEKVENLFTKKFAGKRKKCLTERHTVRYTVELQACPHFGTRNTPSSGTSFYGGYNHEENFSAQEASSQGSSWLSDPHEHQERPQGHQCSPC